MSNISSLVATDSFEPEDDEPYAFVRVFLFIAAVGKIPVVVDDFDDSADDEEETV